MPKLTFSTDELPTGLSNSARAKAWVEQFEKKLGPSNTDVAVNPDRLLQARIEIVPLHALAVMTMSGTFDRVARTRAGIAADGSDALCLVVNTGREPMRFVQRKREILLENGDATIFSEGMTAHFDIPGQVDTFCFRLPRASLSSSVRSPEDFCGNAIDPRSEPVRMLSAYARTMIDIGGIHDPVTAQTISRHMIDLVGLAIGQGREADEAARRGGLRASRIHALIGDIEAGFLDPEFSIHRLAEKYRVTPRHLQELLQETGTSFVERVLECRLTHAYDQLARAHLGHRKISDIAYSSGFNDLSYFHRCFRRRFGMSPADARAL